jgi:hypothetical protein
MEIARQHSQQSEQPAIDPLRRREGLICTSKGGTTSSSIVYALQLQQQSTVVHMQSLTEQHKRKLEVLSKGYAHAQC